VKLTPKLPPEGINAPPETAMRNIGALIVGAAAVLAGFYMLVSLVVDAVVDGLDPATETTLFAEWVPEMLASFEAQGFDDAAQGALMPLFERVRDAVDAPAYDFQVRVACMVEPNALALPGGGVVVTAGLLELLETEEELAFVLGHELGHFRHRDHLRGMGRAAALQLALSMVSTGTGIDPSAAIDIGLQALNSAHSREQEIAADVVGAEALSTLYKGDVSGAHRALDALQRALDSGALDKVNILRSHPVGDVRRGALETLSAARGWHTPDSKGTPLAEALRAACDEAVVAPAP